MMEHKHAGIIYATLVFFFFEKTEMYGWACNPSFLSFFMMSHPYTLLHFREMISYISILIGARPTKKYLTMKFRELYKLRGLSLSASMCEGVAV